MIFEHQTLWVDSLDVLVIYSLPSVIQELSSFFAGETTTCTNVNVTGCSLIQTICSVLPLVIWGHMSCWHSYRIDWWKNFSHTITISSVGDVQRQCSRDYVLLQEPCGRKNKLPEVNFICTMLAVLLNLLELIALWASSIARVMTLLIQINIYN